MPLTPRFSLGVKKDRFNGPPVSGISRPSLGVPLPGSLIHLCSVLEKVPVLSPMPLGRRHKFEGAMAVMIVVPPHKGRHPLASLLQGVEGPIHRIVRAIFHRFEEGLRIRIVVADGRTPERGTNPQFLKHAEHGGALHRGAIVRMQNDPGRLASLGLPKHGLFEGFRRMVGGFAGPDLPSDDLPAVEIQKEVEIEKLPLDQRGQRGCQEGWLGTEFKAERAGLETCPSIEN